MNKEEQIQLLKVNIEINRLESLKEHTAESAERLKTLYAMKYYLIFGDSYYEAI